MHSSDGVMIDNTLSLSKQNNKQTLDIIYSQINFVANVEGCKFLNVIIGPFKNVKAKCPFSHLL